MIDEKQYEWILFVAFYLKDYNIKSEVAIFMACQFALESGYGSSHLAKDYHNITGMRVCYLRPSNQINYHDEKKTNFGQYRKNTDCLDDFMLWLSYQRCHPSCYSDIASYSALLIRTKYCEEKGKYINPETSEYIKRIKSIYNQFLNYGKTE